KGYGRNWGKYAPISVRISFAVPETPVFYANPLFLGISGASQFCSQLIDLKLGLYAGNAEISDTGVLSRKPRKFRHQS
ncbi:TPA: hypothetical protein ACNCIP_004822, partial [Escherichia coli]